MWNPDDDSDLHDAQLAWSLRTPAAQAASFADMDTQLEQVRTEALAAVKRDR